MASRPAAVTLRHYRDRRVTQTPEAALASLRSSVQFAREVANDTGHFTHAAELLDEETRLTGWLQDVRVRCDQPGRHGRYWQTGRYKGRLIFTLECHARGGEVSETIECETAGCAIKHAFGWLQANRYGYVDVRQNRNLPTRRIDASSSWPGLLQADWPVE